MARADVGSSEHPVIVADERVCLLFAVSKTPAGRLHAEERARLNNEHEGSHERSRPTLLGRGAPTGPQHLADAGHTADEERRRFARDVAEWIAATLPPGRQSEASVFAAPRFLGLLRPECERRARGVNLTEGELAQLSGPELVAHPVIRERCAHLPASEG